MPGVLTCTAITIFFSTFFVFLRLVGRRLTHHRWYLYISDGLLIISWVGSFILIIEVFLTVRNAL